MNELKYTKGQTVYLFITEGSNEYRHLKNPSNYNVEPTMESRIIETTVKTVNKIYVTVEYRNTKFEVEENYREHTNYSSNYEIYPTKESIYDTEKAKVIWNKLRRICNYGGKVPYTLEQLTKVAEILNIKED